MIKIKASLNLAKKLILIIFLAGSTLSAQDAPPEKEIGIKAKAAYSFDKQESISLVNGNLTMMIPLGGSFPVNGELSYQFSLNYNAAAWDWSREACVDSNPANVYSEITMAVPREADNAGMGLRLSLGRLVRAQELPFTGQPRPSWSYLAATGAQHAFYNELHPQTTTTPPPQTPTDYTNDGSFLRLRSEPEGCHQAEDINSGCRIFVDFPDGSSHTFEGVTATDKTRYLPSKIQDAFGNTVDISYEVGRWTIRDDHGRTQKVIFSDQDRKYRRVAQLELEAFGNLDKAVYEFVYETRTIERHQYLRTFNDSTCAEDPELGGRYLQADFLIALNLPDGSRYRFDYFDNEFGVTGSKSGAMKWTVLPTGLRRDYSYNQNWTFGDHSPGWPREPEKRVFGIAEKKESDGVTGALFGTWRYQPARADFEAPNDLADTRTFHPCYFETQVTNPKGEVQSYFFQNAKSGLAFEQQMPYTRCNPNNQGSYKEDGPFLSNVTWDDNGNPLRSVWVDYRILHRGDTNNRHQMQSLELVVYHDDPSENSLGRSGWDLTTLKADYHWIQTSFSDFDGLGHARRKEITTNIPHSDSKTIHTTRYNPTLPSFDFLDDVVTHPLPNQPWLLNLYDQVVRHIQNPSGNQRSEEQFLFDPQTGFKLAERKLLNAGQIQSQDLLTIYTADDQGNTISTEYLGGDNGNAGTNPNWQQAVLNNSFSLTADFRIGHTYQFGALATSAYLDETGDPFFYTQQFTIDPDTGLTAASIAEDGITTRYEYDLLNRIVAVFPGNEARIFTRYQTPIIGQPNRSLRLDRRNCTSGTNYDSCSDKLNETNYTYDRRGLLSSQRELTPNTNGSAYALKTFTYDGMGRPLTESTWHYEDGQAFSVIYQDYDPFGQPASIKNPDGSTTFFTYFGVRGRDIDVSIRTSPTTNQRAVTSEHFDALGRLVVLEERAGPNQANVVTTYGYDERGRLEQICIDDNKNRFDNCSGQYRAFTYDPRGLLTAKEDPELRTDGGNGRTRFTYNALGLVVTTDGKGTADDLRHTYDRAGRKTQTRDGLNRLWKEYFYADSNQGVDLRKGKLYQVKRHNRVDLGNGSEDVIVTRTFAYEGVNGRISKIQTRTNNGKAFDTGYVQYDPLGNLLRLEYPACIGPQCGEAGSRRSQNFTFEKGVLTSVSGFADFSYHADGNIAAVNHGNTITDLYQRSVQDWSPLDNITIRDAGQTYWNSGKYRFDGAGNVWAIGSERYSYDLVNRLVAAEINTNTGMQTEVVNYDAFGNITRLERNGGGALLPAPSADSNQITAFGADYDDRGNLVAIQINGATYRYQYDPLGAMTARSGPGVADRFVYDDQGERLVAYDLISQSNSWSLRDQSGSLLRTFEETDQTRLVKDYIRGVDGPVATVTENGEVRHLHKDHLGSIRLITNNQKQVLEENHYFPFGAYTEDPITDGETLRFSGHERDAVGNDADADLDYMHARYYSPHLGRFTSPDPLLGFPESSQSWNRYSYVRNNPIKATDPDGRVLETVLDVIGVGMAVVDVVREPSWKNAGLLALEVGAAVAPGVPSPKAVTLAARAVGKAAKFGDKAKDGARAANATADVGKAAKKQPKVVTIDASKSPEAAKHLEDSGSVGVELTIDRAGKDKRRRDAMKGQATQKGKDRDEAPPAVFKEGSTSVRKIDSSDNRSAGAQLGNQIRDLAEGEKVIIKIINQKE